MIGMGKTKYTIYHNQSCSKSCTAMEALVQSGEDFEIVEYLNDVPSVEELGTIIAKLQCKAHDLIRTTEPIYLQKFEGQDLSEAEWILAMHENPILIQRPIIIHHDKAIVARTADSLKEALIKL